MAVGIGRTATLLTTVAVVLVAATTQVPAAACRRAVVAAAPSAGGEAEAELQCVRRCTVEMLACAVASGCATATLWRRRLGGGRSGARAPCGGGGCEGEYLGCIDVC